jgi:predicted CXXCH cytochrome family protein
MQGPTKETVLGDFSSKTVKHWGEAFTFKVAGENFEVVVKSGGVSTTYPVRFVFGVQPLQQVLVDVGSGRLQALPVAWDTRPKEEGGQQWFHLRGDENTAVGDAEHWKGPKHNWNSVCADCHSTNIEKNYRRENKSYATTFSEIDVACEACHGPGSEHVKSANANKGADDAPGFRKMLKHSARSWVFTEGLPIARLEDATESSEVEACAPCHSRRSNLGPGEGASYHDRHGLSLLDENSYFADGQVKDEVYVYGSFIQSRMHSAGVICSDCHDPHTLKLRKPGNELCIRCHRSEVYNTEAHHFHKAQTPAADCVACHMPERLHMVVDGRRDHRFNVPRPLISKQLSSPDPCTDCHKDKDHAWAQTAIDSHRKGEPKAKVSTAIHMARKQLPGAQAALIKLINDPVHSGMERASAVLMLDQFPWTGNASVIKKASIDKDPLVRRAAATVSAIIPVDVRFELVGNLLADDIRTVRVEAAAAYAGDKVSALSGKSRASITKALEEYIAASTYNADRAEGLASLANLRAVDGEMALAEKIYLEALEVDPGYSIGYLNLADHYRSTGRESEAEELLDGALKNAGDWPLIQHHLGLSRIRLGKTLEAIANLAAASSKRPNNARFAYGYGVALFNEGRKEEGLRVLRAAQKRIPANAKLLEALVTYCGQEGLKDEAATYETALRALRTPSPK